MYQNIFHKELMTFNISNLATSIRVRSWGNVASGRAKVREPPAGLSLLDKDRLGKIWLSYNCKLCYEYFNFKCHILSQGSTAKVDLCPELLFWSNLYKENLLNVIVFDTHTVESMSILTLIWTTSSILHSYLLVFVLFS